MVHFQVSLAVLVYQPNELDLLNFDQGQRLRAQGANNLVRADAEVETARSVLNSPERVRPPARLRGAPLKAFADRRVGLGPIAALLERPDDELCRQLVGPLGVPRLDPEFAMRQRPCRPAGLPLHRHHSLIAPRLGTGDNRRWP
jgi:hypothetical protein